MIKPPRMFSDVSAVFFLSCLFPADTKRKVEQISEELKSLDEMLAGNEVADGTVEVTAEETTSPTINNPDTSVGKAPQS